MSFKKENPLILDNEHFLRFLRDFDAISCQYVLANPNIDDEKKSYMNVPRLNQMYIKLFNEKRKNYTFDLRNHNYSQIYDNLKLIYGEIENIDKFIEIYNLVHEKIIGQYLNIEGLDKLYNQEFFNFEWELHMGINYDKQESAFYRDHFIHQVRNLYEFHVFFDELKLVNNCVEVLFPNDGKIDEPNNTHISRYLSKMTILAVDEIKGNTKRRIKYGSLYKILKEVETIEGHFKYSNNELFSNWLKKNILKNIIRSAGYIAALFHDIGYPIEAVLKRRKNISRFFPNIRYFVENSGHFDEMCGLLSNSLLFTLVKQSELEAKYNQDDKAHGVISALALLLYYYESGVIYSLPPEKRAAIELAAIVIYDHTIDPQYTDSKHKDPYFRLLFHVNPVSYMFRLCDDIQEWERVYFIVDENSHLRICHNCKTPLIRIPVDIQDVLKSKNNNSKDYIIEEKYVEFLHEKELKVDMCACYAKDEFELINTMTKLLANGFSTSLDSMGTGKFIEFDDTEFRKRSDIQFRKMHHVKTCHTILIQSDYKETDNKIFPPTKMMLDIQYSPYKLLQMSFINPDFAKYRSKEIGRIKKFLEMQDGFPRTIIQSDITTNPITLKVKILRDFITDFDKVQKTLGIKKLNVVNLINTINEIKKHISNYKITLKNIYKIIAEKIYKNKNIITRIDRQIEFYIDLLYFEINFVDIETHKNDLKIKFPNYYGQNSIVDYLVDDYLLTCGRKNKINYEGLYKNSDFLLNDYYDIYKIDDRLIDCIHQFCGENNYHPLDANGKNGLDAFIDIYFFKVLANYMYAPFNNDESENII